MRYNLISVVIPAFNEEENIGVVLKDLHEALRKIGIPYEVIVINDGSVDRTAEIAKENNVLVIDNGENLGKGAALKAGFLKARGKYIITMDADGSHRPEDIPKLLNPLLNGDDIDAVTGSRFSDKEGKDSTSILHLIGNNIINALILFLTGRYITDSQSGFRIYKRDALRKLTINSSRYEIESELTIKMLKKGLIIREVPINCVKRKHGSSKISSFRDGFKILKVILKTNFSS